MKKILFPLLTAIVLICGFSSCNDENDLPNVRFIVNFEDATDAGGVLYVVQGETFGIESVTPVNNEDNKAVGLGGATYYWDYRAIGVSMYKPYDFEITVSPETGIGRHVLEIVCPVYAVDKTPARALLSFPVQVVASKADIPDGGSAIVMASPQISDMDD